ncbi:unnamed protein product [Bathycoccus prasinos]
MQQSMSVVLFSDILPNDDETNEQRNRITNWLWCNCALYASAKEYKRGGQQYQRVQSRSLLLPNNTRVFSKKSVRCVGLDTKKIGESPSEQSLAVLSSPRTNNSE